MLSEGTYSSLIHETEAGREGETAMAQHGAYPRRSNVVGGFLAILILCTDLGACSISSTQSVLQQPTATGGAKAPIATVPPTATASPTSVPAQANVVEVSSAIVSVGSNATGTASASCSSGDPLLGGGFIARLSGGNDGIAPTDSYPSAASTWTVGVSTLADTIQLTAIAVCLQANFAVTTQVAQASNSGPDTTVTCPSGSVLTGGGFRSGGGRCGVSRPSQRHPHQLRGLRNGRVESCHHAIAIEDRRQWRGGLQWGKLSVRPASGRRRLQRLSAVERHVLACLPQ